MPWFLTPHGPHFVVEPGTIDEYERRDYTLLTSQQAADYFAGVAFPDPPSFATEAEVPGIVASAVTVGTGPVAEALRAAFATRDDLLTSRAIPAPVVANRCQTHLTNGTGAVGTSRMRHIARGDSTNLRLVYTNFRIDPDGPGGDLAAAGAITISAAIEVGGTVFPVTFGGRRTITIDSGGIAVADPLGLSVADGSAIWSRTYLSSGSPAAVAASDDQTGEGFTATTDLTATGAAAPTVTFTYIYGPTAVIGASPNPKPTIGIAGDSIAFGQGDPIGADRNSGFLVRACNTATLPYWQAAAPAERLSAVAAQGGYRYRLPLLTDCTVIVCEYGRNDIDLGVATVKTNLVAVWRALGARGARIHQTTITPQSSSTDAWATTGSQTPAANEGNRYQINDWIRDGAPVNATTFVPVAIGAVGIRSGQPGHPLAGWIEVADSVESARNSGIWKAGFTADGLHPDGDGHAAMAAVVDVAALI